LLDHLEIIYSADEVQKIAWQLESFRAGGVREIGGGFAPEVSGPDAGHPQLHAGTQAAFQPMAQSPGAAQGHGLEDRYKSVQVEDSETAVRTMAAYIDLNPVRAGMVEDPKDYRWSGFGEAVAGGQSARAGLSRLVKTETGYDASTSTWRRSRRFTDAGCMTKAKWSSTTMASDPSRLCGRDGGDGHQPPTRRDCAARISEDAFAAFHGGCGDRVQGV